MKKIQVLFVVSILFLLAGCGKTSVNNPQTKSQTNQAQTQKADTESTGTKNNDSKPKEEIVVNEINRIKGEECITGGPDERYKNLPPANESYTYTDPFNSISLNIPYNKNWKFEGCEISPFTQLRNGNGVIVFFGQPSGSSWGPDQYELLINKSRTIEDIQKELADSTKHSASSLPQNEMKKITVNSLNAFRWQENEMIEQIFIEIIGKKYNYTFVAGVNEEKALIKVIESLKLL